MQANVGKSDRVLRVIVGLALLSLLWWLPGRERWLGLLGLVPLLTAALGWCPAYALVGMSSCAAHERLPRRPAP